MRRLLIAVVIAYLPADAHTQEVNRSGDAVVITNHATVVTEVYIKKDGAECGTGITKPCLPGESCFANITIQGDAAKALWEVMKIHGTKLNEAAADEYSASKSGAIECSETICRIGYDVKHNVLTVPRYCDEE